MEQPADDQNVILLIRHLTLRNNRQFTYGEMNCMVCVQVVEVSEAHIRTCHARWPD